MWINQALTKNELQNDVHIGVVSDIIDDMLTVSSHTKIANVKIASPFSLAEMPSIGQEVLLLLQKSGEYLCVGQVKSPSGLEEGEVLLSNNAGSYVKLMANGDVVINGLTISKAGQIINA